MSKNKKKRNSKMTTNRSREKYAPDPVDSIGRYLNRILKAANKERENEKYKKEIDRIDKEICLILQLLNLFDRRHNEISDESMTEKYVTNDVAIVAEKNMAFLDKAILNFMAENNGEVLKDNFLFLRRAENATFLKAKAHALNSLKECIKECVTDPSRNSTVKFDMGEHCFSKKHSENVKVLDKLMKFYADRAKSNVDDDENCFDTFLKEMDSLTTARQDRFMYINIAVREKEGNSRVRPSDEYNEFWQMETQFLMSLLNTNCKIRGEIRDKLEENLKLLIQYKEYEEFSGDDEVFHHLFGNINTLYYESKDILETEDFLMDELESLNWKRNFAFVQASYLDIRSNSTSFLNCITDNRKRRRRKCK